jgi:hypothetical protein
MLAINPSLDIEVDPCVAGTGFDDNAAAAIQFRARAGILNQLGLTGNRGAGQ